MSERGEEEEEKEEDDDEILMQKIPTHMKCDVLLITYNSPLLNSFLPSFYPIPSCPVPFLTSPPLPLSPPAISQQSNNPPGSPGRGHKPPYRSLLPYSTYLTSREKKDFKIDPEKEK